MLKILVLLGILAVVIFVFFGPGRRRDRQAGRSTAPARPASAQPAKKVPMLACAHCGLHLPRDEAAFDVAGQPYCTPEHRVAGPR